LKGACDGGLYVPHSEEGKRFPGWDHKEKKYDPAVHKKYIFGGHVAAYMELLEKDEKRYKTQFGKYIAQNIKPADLEKLYASVHQAIRKDPSSKSKYATLTPEKKKKAKKLEDKKKNKGKSFSTKRLTHQQRKEQTSARKLKALEENSKDKEVTETKDKEEEDEIEDE